MTGKRVGTSSAIPLPFEVELTNRLMVGGPLNMAANAGVSFRGCSVHAGQCLLAARSVAIILVYSPDAVMQVTAPCEHPSSRRVRSKVSLPFQPVPGQRHLAVGALPFEKIADEYAQ